MMRVITLLARHGTEQYADATGNIDALFAGQLPEVQHDLIISDNALPAAYQEQLDRGRVLIGSSNAHWEFSAWDRAIDYLGSRIDDYDLVHLATSAFRALDVRHLDRFDASMLASAHRLEAAFGHIDNFLEPITLLGRSSQAWLRSSWVFLKPHHVRLLGSLVSISDGAAFFSGNPDAPFRADAPLSVELRRYIVGYLTGARPGHEWHRHFSLSTETLAQFEAKTLAILNEHMLSVRLRSQGCVMVDATWLWTRHRQWPDQQPPVIPSWWWQVAARELVLRHEAGAAPTVRAELVVGECWDIARSHGSQTARSILARAVASDPWLLGNRAVLGALRRWMVSAG